MNPLVLFLILFLALAGMGTIWFIINSSKCIVPKVNSCDSGYAPLCKESTGDWTCNLIQDVCGDNPFSSETCSSTICEYDTDAAQYKWHCTEFCDDTKNIQQGTYKPYPDSNVNWVVAYDKGSTTKTCMFGTCKKGFSGIPCHPINTKFICLSGGENGIFIKSTITDTNDTKINTTHTFFDIRQMNDYSYIAADKDGVYTSSDLSTWTNVSTLKNKYISIMQLQDGTYLGINVNITTGGDFTYTYYTGTGLDDSKWTTINIGFDNNKITQLEDGSFIAYSTIDHTIRTATNLKDTWKVVFIDDNIFEINKLKDGTYIKIDINSNVYTNTSLTLTGWTPLNYKMLWITEVFSN